MLASVIAHSLARGSYHVIGNFSAEDKPSVLGIVDKHITVTLNILNNLVTIPAISTGLESMTVEELLAYVDTDEEKILLLLALSSGDRLFLESLVK